MPRIFHRYFASAWIALALMTELAPAGTVRTLDGKSLEGELRFNDSGALIVTPPQGEPVTVALTNLSRATFASGMYFSSGSILPNGWAAQDHGDTRGFARLDGGTLSLRVEGLSTNATACHFVSRAMPSDGGITVRVDDVAGNGTAHAGVMIRGDDNSFASLALGNDGKLWFHCRAESDKKEVRLTPGPRASAPIWLRLQKRDKSLTAMWSADGGSWQTLASETVKFPEREDNGMKTLRASCGVFALSRAKGTVATARVTPVNLAMHGLLGEYFAGRDFSKLRMARLDPQVRFNWGTSPPDPALDRDNFSVRWTGRLIAPRSSGYTFYFDADDRATLWINDVEVPQHGFKRREKDPLPVPISLVAGSGVKIRLEYEEGDGPASVKLGWSLPGKSPSEIAATNFISIFSATNSPESIALGRATNSGPATRGVLLRNGTFIAGTVAKADASAVWLSFGGKKDVPVLNSKVARILLRAPRTPLPFDIAQGRSGVFTKTGDFFESEFHSIEYGSLQMSSVLFGLKKFWIDGGEPVAVVLNDCVPFSTTGFEVLMLDGSLIRGMKMGVTDNSISVDEAVLGSVAFPMADLYEIRRAGVAHAR